MTIKFKDMVSAQGCVMKMNGRFFDRRQVSDPAKFSTHAYPQIHASIYTGKERYQKSKGAQDFGDEDADKEERERLDNFATWLVDGED